MKLAISTLAVALLLATGTDANAVKGRATVPVVQPFEQKVEQPDSYSVPSAEVVKKEESTVSTGHYHQHNDQKQYRSNNGYLAVKQIQSIPAAHYQHQSTGTPVVYNTVPKPVVHQRQGHSYNQKTQYNYGQQQQTYVPSTRRVTIPVGQTTYYTPKVVDEPKPNQYQSRSAKYHHHQQQTYHHQPVVAHKQVSEHYHHYKTPKFVEQVPVVQYQPVKSYQHQYSYSKQPVSYQNQHQYSYYQASQPVVYQEPVTRHYQYQISRPQSVVSTVSVPSSQVYYGSGQQTIQTRNDVQPVPVVVYPVRTISSVHTLPVQQTVSTVAAVQPVRTVSNVQSYVPDMSYGKRVVADRPITTVTIEDMPTYHNQYSTKQTYGRMVAGKDHSVTAKKVAVKHEEKEETNVESSVDAPVEPTVESTADQSPDEVVQPAPVTTSKNEPSKVDYSVPEEGAPVYGVDYQGRTVAWAQPFGQEKIEQVYLSDFDNTEPLPLTVVDPTTTN